MLHRSYTSTPPSLIIAEKAARWVAMFGDPPAPRAIADALGHLLVVCVFADLAYDPPGRLTRGQRRVRCRNKPRVLCPALLAAG